MKKILFAAALVAGTAFGFAKDNIQKTEVKTVTTKEAKQVVETTEINSLDDLLRKATCMDVHAFFDEVELPNGDIDYVFAGSMEVTYECDNAEVNLYIWF